MFEGISEKEFLAAKIVDENPDDDAGDGVDETDGGCFDVFIDVDGAGMQVDVLIKPEEVEEVREKDDGNRGKEGVAESGLEDGNGHQDVVLAIVAIGGRGSEGENGVNQDRNGGKSELGWGGTNLVNEEPAKEEQVPEESGAHEGEEEGSDRAPDAGEEFVGKDKEEDDEEIQRAEDEFLKTRVLQIGAVPERKDVTHKNLIREARVER